MSSALVVLYHANCTDGFGAAWAAWKALGDAATYVPVQYGKPYPPEIDGGVRALYIVDFSYPLETLKRLADCAEEMVVIDHHQTAEQPLKEFADLALEHVTVIFGWGTSGAPMTWKHFHGRQPVPRLLEYVKDRDLWEWELPGSREVSAALASYPKDFEVWDGLVNQSEPEPTYLQAEGEAILRYQQQQVETHATQAVLQDVGGYQVPVVNATTLMSEIGEALCERFSDAPFSASYFVRADGARVWSLRSRNGFDVSEVAKAQGGGGHQAAAGFTEETR